MAKASSVKSSKRKNSITPGVHPFIVSYFHGTLSGPKVASEDSLANPTFLSLCPPLPLGKCIIGIYSSFYVLIVWGSKREAMLLKHLLNLWAIYCSPQVQLLSSVVHTFLMRSVSVNRCYFHPLCSTFRKPTSHSAFIRVAKYHLQH